MLHDTTRSYSYHDRDDRDRDCDADDREDEFDEANFSFAGLSCRTVPPWHTW